MKYKVRCLDCRYDEENNMLVVLAFCEDFGEQRIFTIPQSDFHYKNADKPAPAEEMIRLAHIMKGKRFTWDLRDDPKKVPISSGEQSQIAEVYKQDVGKQLDEITDNLQNTNRRTLNRVADVVERDRKRKAENPPTEKDIMDEILMREQLRKTGGLF